MAIFRRSSKTVIKNIYRKAERRSGKGEALYRVTTYWFLIVPVYSYDEVLAS